MRSVETAAAQRTAAALSRSIRHEPQSPPCPPLSPRTSSAESGTVKCTRPAFQQVKVIQPAGRFDTSRKKYHCLRCLLAPNRGLPEPSREVFAVVNELHCDRGGAAESTYRIVQKYFTVFSLTSESTTHEPQIRFEDSLILSSFFRISTAS